jgi:hypothetical protein
LVSSDLTLRALTGLLARDSLKNPCGSRIRACALADPERAFDWVGPLFAARFTPMPQVGRWPVSASFW